MVWNLEIFDDNLIKVAQFRAGNSSRHFARSQTREILAYLSTFPAYKPSPGPDRLNRGRYLYPLWRNRVRPQV